MANISGKYETVLVISLTLGDDGVANMVEKFKNLIEQSATLESVDEWGKRRLAYRFGFTTVPQSTTAL